MRNLQLEAELAAHSEHRAPPLTWWRLLPAHVFIAERGVVEAAVASVVTASRLAPPDLIGELLSALEEEKASVFNQLATHFASMDAMQMGILWEIAGSSSALAAASYDPVGLLGTLKGLTEPYTTARRDLRLSVATTWLAEMGGLLNPRAMSRVDWIRSCPGEEAYATSRDDSADWEDTE